MANKPIDSVHHVEKVRASSAKQIAGDNLSFSAFDLFFEDERGAVQLQIFLPAHRHDYAERLVAAINGVAAA